MTFTDDDWKRLKEDGHDNLPWLKPLLARLEAAEEICEWFPKAFPKFDLKQHYGYKKWREAAGK